MITRKAVLAAFLLAGALAGCTDLNVTDPNQRTADTFWKTEADATQGVNAVTNDGTARPTKPMKAPSAWRSTAHNP